VGLVGSGLLCRGGKVLRSAFEDNSDIETNASREALTSVPAAP
jgi:hypothetical protein